MTGSPPRGVWAGPVDLTLDLGGRTLAAAQAAWREAFAAGLYGPLPHGPDRISASRQPLDGEPAERIVIEVGAAGTTFTTDAALWMPDGKPRGLIAGLDFTGPAGLLISESFPLDPKARVHTRPELGAKDGRLEDVLRGTALSRWPVDMMLGHGFAVLVSCYGSWAPDDPEHWQRHGLGALFPGTGAISLWAWALHRLVDAAEALGLPGPVAVAGHSRLGKAALWAAANDARIGTVFANASGCGGAAPARHPAGETLSDMAERFPHWTVRGQRPLAVDQHQLLACIAPRRLYLASAEDDLWADPLGSYAALVAASDAWPGETGWPTPEAMWSGGRRRMSGKLGHHLRPGGHDLLPYDWRQFLDFLIAGQRAPKMP